MRIISACVAALALAGGASAATVRTVEFGDAFTYVAERPVASVAPFTVVGEPRTQRQGVTYRLACLSEACLGAGPSRRVRLGTTTIVVRGRVTPAAVAAGLSAYRRNTALPAARASTGAVSRGLALVAALAALIAVAALLLGLPRRRAHVDALERAIRLLRESMRRSASDRRRAADLLARVTSERGLSDDATSVAWSRRDPASSDAERLAARAAQERA